MNLEEADQAPDLELNEIVWKAVRGRDAVMPPPVRAAFVRPVEDEDEKYQDYGSPCGNVTVRPVRADSRAASRISVTIRLFSRDDRPDGWTSPRTTAAR